jgi:transposase
MSKPRRRYAREFKIEAVKLVTEGGLTIQQVARDLDIHPNTLSKWRRQFASDPKGAFPGKGHQSPDEEEIRRLKRELARVKQERDILKKAVGYFANDPD